MANYIHMIEPDLFGLDVDRVIRVRFEVHDDEYSHSSLVSCNPVAWGTIDALSDGFRTLHIEVENIELDEMEHLFLALDQLYKEVRKTVELV